MIDLCKNLIRFKIYRKEYQRACKIHWDGFMISLKINVKGNKSMSFYSFNKVYQKMLIVASF